jgi:hypothetical protein
MLEFYSIKLATLYQVNLMLFIAPGMKNENKNIIKRQSKYQ